jgi:hypothetical protein
MTADLNFPKNVEKSDSAKTLGNDNRIKTPANQVRALITRHGQQARIETNELISDALTVPLITLFSFR